MPNQKNRANGSNSASSSVEELMLAALERGGNTLETGRFLVTFKENVKEEGVNFLRETGMRVMDARDFDNQEVLLESAGDADSIYLPEIGVALVSGDAAAERNMSSMSTLESVTANHPLESVDPEYFVFASDLYTEAMRGYIEKSARTSGDYLRGFLQAAEMIAKEYGLSDRDQPQVDIEEQALVLGATWGLNACKVPPSTRSGMGIRVAVLDTGMDLGHPDFSGRQVVSKSFITGQTVQDMHGHGTHCIGTACGTKTPAGSIARYGIGHRAPIFVGKVLSNSGNGTQMASLAGINWAIANRCSVISMSLGSPSPVHPAYVAAGQSALNNECLIIAAAGNEASPTGSPANASTIMSVASLDSNLKPSSFSNFGKIEIAGPGRDIFSTWPRPLSYRTISGTSMATPHVAGCAALWAETSPNLRGMNLWRKLMSTARPLPGLPPSRVGAGLVQAPQ